MPPIVVDSADLSGLPGLVRLGQGRHCRLPIARHARRGGPADLHLRAPAGISASIVLQDGAAHIELRAGYAVSGPRQVVVEMANATGAMRHAITVDVQQLRWLAVHSWAQGEGPSPRKHPTFLPLPGGERYLLWGGSGYTVEEALLDDAWTWELAASRWQRLHPAGNPPPQASRRSALVDDGTAAWLFGGYGSIDAGASGPHCSNALYRAVLGGDSVSLSDVAQSDPPPPRALHALAHDRPSGRLVCFGGFGGPHETAPLGDTWIGHPDADRVTWRRLPTPAGPSARYGLFYGHDAERRRLIVFGGAQGIASIDVATDTWVLDLAADPPAWGRLIAGDEPGTPTGRRNGVQVFDPTGPRIFMFGGTADARDSEPGLWVLDLVPGRERWSRLDLPGAPVIRTSAVGLYDRQRGHVVVGFGNAPGRPFRDLAVLGYE